MTTMATLGLGPVAELRQQLGAGSSGRAVPPAPPRCFGSRQPLPAGLRRPAFSNIRRFPNRTGPSAVFGAFGSASPAAPGRKSFLDEAHGEDEPVTLGWPEFDPTQFEVRGDLGSGSFGSVYEAEDVDTGELVAIKKMAKIRRNQRPARTASKLQREADLLTRMQTSSGFTVRLVGRYEDHDYVYLVTEVLAGGTLEEFLAASGGTMTEDVLRWVAEDILGFISECHDNGLVYADAKPANFMLENSLGAWRVKAIDMGCSQILPTDGRRLEMRSGTPLYFAPEVFQRSYHMEADLWSVGVMLYVFAVGHNPWFKSLKGVVPNDVMDKVLGEDVPYVEEEWSTVSPELRNLVESLLNKNVEERLTAEEALVHPWFHMDDQPAPSQPEEPEFSSNVVPLPNERKLSSLAGGKQEINAC